MFGPTFLVAPVIRKLSELRRGKGGAPLFPVYLPPGDWFDCWTGRLAHGPAVVEAAARLDIVPLFVRAGAIVPMMRPAERIPAGLLDPLELALYPRGSSSYTLIEEEGRTEFRLEPAKRGYSLEWSGPIARKLVRRVSAPTGDPAGQGRAEAPHPLRYLT
jgi:alpha-glucosidase (family GH31 glycosyl hydrolase)